VISVTYISCAIVIRSSLPQSPAWSKALKDRSIASGRGSGEAVVSAVCNLLSLQWRLEPSAYAVNSRLCAPALRLPTLPFRQVQMISSLPPGVFQDISATENVRPRRSLHCRAVFSGNRLNRISILFNY
jgi:hypothetical protein